MNKRTCLVLIVLAILLFISSGLAKAIELKDFQKNSPTQYDFPSATAVILLDEITCDVNSDYTRTQTEHEIIKILNLGAIERFGVLTYYYNSDFQEVNVELASVLTSDGKIIFLQPEFIKDYAPLEKLKLFSKIRSKVIKFPQLKPGCIIEYKVSLKEKRPFIPNQFWAVSFTQDYQPILESRFLVKIPQEFKSFQYKVFGNMEVSPVITKTQEKTTYTFIAKDCMPISQEVAEPALPDLASQIRATSLSSWDEFADSYNKGISEKIHPASKVFTLTQKIISDKNTEQEKIKAIHKYISDNIELIDMGFGLFGYSTHMPEEVLKHKQGDKADIMVLFLSMLNAAQINGYPALVSTREHGKLKEDIADPQQFDYCLAAMPNGESFWFLDPSSKFSPKQLLTAELQNRKALVILPGKSKLVFTDEYPYYFNREESRYECIVKTDGTIQVGAEIKEYGCQDTLLREFFSLFSEGTSKLLMDLLVKTVSPDAKLIECYISPIKDTEYPLTIDLSFEIPDYAKSELNSFYFRLPIFPAKKIKSLVLQDPKERVYPLVLNTPTQTAKSIHIIFPENMKPKSLPAPVYIENSVGSYQFIYNIKGNNFYGYCRLDIKKSEIMPAEFGEFKELIETSFRTEGEMILLEKGT